MKNYASEYTILIVDNIPENVLLIRAILSDEGYTLISANNGSEALEIARKQRPNLILLDIVLPEMDGYEVLQRLKAYPETHHIPVMIMSAQPDMSGIVKGYRLGAAEYITKPFQREELVKRIAPHYKLYGTERTRKELEAAVESRDLLYSVIAHDLRTPIGSLKMLNHAILKTVDKEGLEEHVYEMLLTMNRKLEDTFLLLENLLKWSKNSRDKQPLYRRETDLNSLVDGLVAVYRPIAEQKRVTISLEGMDKELMGMVDAGLVKTIIRNLLSNAIKFCYEGGRVEIATRTENGYMFCRVKDSGKGIKKEDREKLLDPESHFTTFGTNGESGSGLGLMICHALVQLHEGELWFESEEGKGSTFHFSLKIR
ncbi:MAG: hybrid sensor histidine kinase/response regulator [Tannerellaceae bacterium]|jgi:two-component system sensor histidine kinase/response regulator|nr:hybrid sensor histidine kinase/response regulator [Tannerellaceae bacterium]